MTRLSGADPALRTECDRVLREAALDDIVVAALCPGGGSAPFGVPTIVLVGGDGRQTSPEAEALAAWLRGDATVWLRLVLVMPGVERGELLFEARTMVRRDRRKTVAAVLAGLPGWLRQAVLRHKRGMTLGAVPLPGPWQPLAAGPARTAWAWVRAVLAYARSLFTLEQWNVGVAPVADPRALVEQWDWRAVVWFPRPPARTFLADPFLVDGGDRGITILCERLDYADGKGVLVAVECDRTLHPKGERTIADLPVHLSYPHPIEDGGQVLVAPEMGESGRAELFRVRSDGALEHRGILVALPLVDRVVFRHDGLWWLLGTRSDTGSTLGLHGWFAEDLGGPWTEHPLNPLKCDVTSSRPAGPVMAVGGRLVRPAQDCSHAYGGAIVWCEIISLSRTAFHERVIGRIDPDREGPYPDGTHTIGWRDGVAVIDAKRHVFDWRAPFIQRRMARQSAARTRRSRLPALPSDHSRPGT